MMTEADLDKLAAYALGDCCLELTERGCDRSLLACTLASLLGAILATIDCCDEHQAEARATVLKVLEENLASHRERWREHKASRDFPPCQGRA